jgi:6-phosphofructokinase 1
LSTQFGARAAELINDGKFGYSVAKMGNVISENKLSEMAAKAKFVDAYSDVVKTARNIGVCFGNEAVSGVSVAGVSSE